MGYNQNLCRSKKNMCEVKIVFWKFQRAIVANLDGYQRQDVWLRRNTSIADNIPQDCQIRHPSTGEVINDRDLIIVE